MPTNQFALYPTWLILYVIRVIIPMLMLSITALKILLKSGKKIQREFNIEYVRALPDISDSGSSETLGNVLVQGFLMEQALFPLRSRSRGVIAPPATPLHPNIPRRTPNR